MNQLFWAFVSGYSASQILSGKINLRYFFAGFIFMQLVIGLVEYRLSKEEVLVEVRQDTPEALPQTEVRQRKGFKEERN